MLYEVKFSKIKETIKPENNFRTTDILKVSY